jgi:hypothetical protein
MRYVRKPAASNAKINNAGLLLCQKQPKAYEQKAALALVNE